MGAASLKLEARSTATVIADRGKTYNAAECAANVWGARVSAKWVLKHMGKLGQRPGREWFIYESDAIQFREDWLANQRGEQ